jgi:hypothetical protein
MDTIAMGMATSIQLDIQSSLPADELYKRVRRASNFSSWQRSCRNAWLAVPIRPEIEISC